MDNNQLAVLLCSKKNMQIQAGPHSILGIIKFSDLKFTHIKETGEVLDYKELIFKYIKVYYFLYI